MARATVRNRGQTTIPKAVREHLGIRPGDEVEFVVRADGEVLVKSATEDIRNLKGLLFKPGRRPVSLEETEKAIQRGACGL